MDLTQKIIDINTVKNKIITGDSLQVLKQLPDNSIDCVMTSPPYWALRNYQVAGQLGLEKDFNEYLIKLCDIFSEIKRVLKDSGTCWVNLGDSYSNSGGNHKNSKLQGKNYELKDTKHKADIPAKNLCLIPFKFVIEMQNRGWYVRNVVIWYKPNSMPESVKDRLTKTYEFLFFFTKSKQYYFDIDSIRVPLKESSIARMAYPLDNLGDAFMPMVKSAERKKVLLRNTNSFNYRVRDSEKKGELCPQFKASQFEIKKYKTRGSLRPVTGENVYFETGLGYSEKYNNLKGKNPGDFWEISTKGFNEMHFAVYPEKLCLIPLQAGCPKDGIVLDPFSGSGTTCLAAKKLNRQYIGIELNNKYVVMSEKRIHNKAGLL